MTTDVAQAAIDKALRDADRATEIEIGRLLAPLSDEIVVALTPSGALGQMMMISSPMFNALPDHLRDRLVDHMQHALETLRRPVSERGIG